MITFRGSLQAAAFIRPSVEPSVFVKSLHICRKSLFSTCTVLLMVSQASHVIVSEMEGSQYSREYGITRYTQAHYASRGFRGACMS